MKKICLLIASLFIWVTVKSQSISIGTGMALDANNNEKSFLFVPVELQWQPFNNAVSFFLSYDFGLNTHTNGDAYTLTPSLSAHINVKEKIRTEVLTLGMNLNIRLLRIGKENSLGLLWVPLGLSFQYFITSYPNFDPENYKILNQDINRRNSGLISAYGLYYHFNDNKMIAFKIQTPLYSSRAADFNFKYAAPARFMFAWQFKLKKQK